MNELEQRIKDQLIAEADRFERRTPAAAGAPWLTPGVRRRLRRKQLGTVLLSIALVAVLGVGSFAAVRVATRATGGPAVPAGIGPMPNGAQDAPPGWPKVVFGRGARPSIEYDPGQRASLIGPKVLVAYGSVVYRGRTPLTWYLDAYEEKRGLYPDGTVVYRTQPCDELFASESDGTGGGGGGCSSVSQSAHPNHPHWIGLSSGNNGDVPLIEYDGVLSPGVARVQVRPTSARAFDVRILRGAPRFRENYFLFFAPKAQRGEVVAFDAAGRTLQRVPFCWSDMPSFSGWAGGSFGGSFGGPGPDQGRGSNVGITIPTDTARGKATGSNGFC